MPVGSGGSIAPFVAQARDQLVLGDFTTAASLDIQGKAPDGAYVDIFDDGAGFLTLDAVAGVALRPSNAGGLPILTCQLPDATPAFDISKNGYATSKLHSAPADADLSAGHLMLWFDQTNGAAKLMVKAKQADGTVKTAAIALA
jgi:hypothetical protein